MNKSDKETEWKKVMDFYDDLIKQYNWKQEPMLLLINRLKEIGFWDNYHPSTSHEALGLSLELNDEENLEQPMVYILYRSEGDNFEIFYQNKQGNDIDKRKCGREISKEEFDLMEHWLTKRQKLL